MPVSSTKTVGDRRHAFLAGGGQLGCLIAAFDWASTSIGSIESWPQSLKTAVSLILRSKVPIVMLWGEDGVMLYNDAYSVFAGGRHPQLLGSKVREGWPEVADFNDNVMKVVLAGAYKDQDLEIDGVGQIGSQPVLWRHGLTRYGRCFAQEAKHFIPVGRRSLY